MSCRIVSIHCCPVKTLSFQTIKSCNIKKNCGMPNDRIFAFSKGINFDVAIDSVSKISSVKEKPIVIRIND